MKGMPHLHCASGSGRRAHWVDSTLYVNQGLGMLDVAPEA
jgi:hypothetical protein